MVNYNLPVTIIGLQQSHFMVNTDKMDSIEFGTVYSILYRVKVLIFIPVFTIVILAELIGASRSEAPH